MLFEGRVKGLKNTNHHTKYKIKIITDILGVYLTSCFMLRRFIIKDRETFFTAAQRSQVVWKIMMRAKYDDSEKVRCENMLNKSLTAKIDPDSQNDER
jgi:hypothetical protein